MSNVEKLLSGARDLMHQARLNQAINMCTAAIKEEPGNSQIYRLLGEIAYAMDNKNLAIAAYLSALHIEIAKVEHYGLTEQTLPMYERIPDDLKAQLPVKGAFLLYYDTNTLRNLAHAVADFDDNALNEEAQLRLYKQLYRYSLMQNVESYKALLAENDLTEADYMDAEESFYIPIGNELAQAWLRFDEIGSLDVGRLYFGTEPAGKEQAPPKTDENLEAVNKLYGTLFSQLMQFVDPDSVQKEYTAMLTGEKMTMTGKEAVYEHSLLQKMASLTAKQGMLLELLKEFVRTKEAYTTDALDEKLAEAEKQSMSSYNQVIPMLKQMYQGSEQERVAQLERDYKLYSFTNSLLMDLVMMLNDNSALLTRLAIVSPEINANIVQQYCGYYLSEMFPA
ncbi:hypothetical protein [Kurthia huakuii]|uniref:hypothetical protein n=1 Tax=Kurthia huakuii TaxID=1421019 RepID=UPI0004B0B019|nr:hypothetical protein [Kurthia huakuii]MBM7698233.1 Trp operon repressor [Kurthia huakuii]